MARRPTALETVGLFGEHAAGTGARACAVDCRGNVGVSLRPAMASVYDIHNQSLVRNAGEQNTSCTTYHEHGL